MSELQRFKDELEQELVAAMTRKTSATTTGTARSPLKAAQARPFLAATLAAGIFIIAALAAGTTLYTTPADAISIDRTDSQIEISIVDVIRDPDGVVAKLADELGISATMEAVPVPPELVGRVSAVDTTEHIAHEANADGSIQTITLATSFSGSLTIEYGRAAESGELYDTTTTDPSCADVFGLSPSQSLDQLGDLGGSLRYESVSSDGDVKTQIELKSIPDNYSLVDLIPLSSDSYLVTFAENPETEPVHPNCV